MSEHSEATTQPATAEEITEVIAELEQYRERLMNDTLAFAKRAKVQKSAAMSQLENHPELAKIDAMLQNLRTQQAALGE